MLIAASLANDVPNGENAKCQAIALDASAKTSFTKGPACLPQVGGKEQRKPYGHFVHVIATDSPFTAGCSLVVTGGFNHLGEGYLGWKRKILWSKATLLLVLQAFPIQSEPEP